MIQPIRKHGSYKEIEDAVFNMADGEVSPVIHAGGQYVILKREGLLPARQVKFEQAVPQLEESLRDRKMHAVAQDIFQQLQEQAKGKIENVWNDPAKRAKMPGVAALVNGDQITLARAGRGVRRAARPGNPGRDDQPQDSGAGLPEAGHHRDRAGHRPGNRPGRGDRRQVEARRLARRGRLAGIGHQEAGRPLGRLSQRRRLALGRA